jgi:hypothetical protein
MPRAAKPKTAPVAAAPILSLAEASSLTVSTVSRMFAIEYQGRRRSFVIQGKLVYQLENSKLPKGQSIYSLLKAEGVPEGSVHQAKMTADMLGALVVPGHLSESRFDEVITFNVARQARKLWQGKGKIKMDALALANLMAEGTSAQIGAELECLVEHGQTLAQRELAIEAKRKAEEDETAAKAAAERLQVEEAARLQAELAEANAERDRLAAEAFARADADAIAKATQVPATPAPAATAPAPVTSPALVVTSPAPAPAEPAGEEDAGDEAPAEIEDEDEDPELAEEDDQEEAPAPPIAIIRGSSAPPPPAPVSSLADITERMDDLLLESLALGHEDIGRLVAFLRKSADDLAATLPAELKAVA